VTDGPDSQAGDDGETGMSDLFDELVELEDLVDTPTCRLPNV